MLGGYIVHEQQQPFAQGAGRRLCIGQPRGGGDELLRLIAVDRLHQRVARGKMTVERPSPDTRSPRNLIEAGPRSFFSKGSLRGFEQADAVPLRVGARLAGDSGFPLINHAENTP